MPWRKYSGKTTISAFWATACSTALTAPTRFSSSVGNGELECGFSRAAGPDGAEMGDVCASAIRMVGNGVVCDGYAVMRSSVVHTRYMRSVVRRRKTELGARADSSGVSEVGSGAARVEWTWAVEAA
jgi:hypothetical protein